MDKSWKHYCRWWNVAHHEQFLLLWQWFQRWYAENASQHQCWKFSSVIKLIFSYNCCTLQLLWFNPFPHTTNLQQTTLKTYWQNRGKSVYYNKDTINEKSGKHVTKGEMAGFELFLLLSVFSKVVCSRDITNSLYVGKG